MLVLEPNAFDVAAVDLTALFGDAVATGGTTAVVDVRRVVSFQGPGGTLGTARAAVTREPGKQFQRGRSIEYWGYTTKARSFENALDRWVRRRKGNRALSHSLSVCVHESV